MAEAAYVAQTDTEDLGATDIPPPTSELEASNERIDDTAYLRASSAAPPARN